jgi:hypothetical protein
MNRNPKFHYAPILPVGQIKPNRLTRRQLVVLAIGWSLAMAGTLFLLTPHGRALLAMFWGES